LVPLVQLGVSDHRQSTEHVHHAGRIAERILTLKPAVRIVPGRPRMASPWQILFFVFQIDSQRPFSFAFGDSWRPDQTETRNESSTRRSFLRGKQKTNLDTAKLREGASGSTWTVASINDWNRIAISFRGVHGPYQPTWVTSHLARQRGQDAPNETLCTTTPTGHGTFGALNRVQCSLGSRLPRAPRMVRPNPTAWKWNSICGRRTVTSTPSGTVARYKCTHA
jgi:hypothetical protein